MTIPRITYDPSTSLQWQITISQNYEFHQATRQKPAGRSGMHSSLVCKSNEKPKQKTRRKTPSKSQLSGRHFEYFIRPSLHLLCEWHWKGYRNESHRVREACVLKEKKDQKEHQAVCARSACGPSRTHDAKLTDIFNTDDCSLLLDKKRYLTHCWTYTRTRLVLFFHAECVLNSIMNWAYIYICNFFKMKEITLNTLYRKFW